MRPQKTRGEADRHQVKAEQFLQKAKSALAPNRASLNRLENAATTLQGAQENLEQARSYQKANPGTTIIITSAFTAVSKTLDQLENVQQDIQDAYRDETHEISPQDIKSVIQNAANAAKNEVDNALAFLVQADGEQEASLVPRELEQAAKNPAVLSILATAFAIGVALAIYDIRAFGITTLGALTTQQGLMLYAIAISLKTQGNKKRIDLCAILAIIMTILLSGSMIVLGAGPRATLQVTGITFFFVLLEWAAARAIASQHQPDHQRERPYNWK